MKSTLTSFFFLLFAFNFALAQKGRVQGRITASDGGEPIFRATVMQEGRASGTFTDADGRYAFDLPAGPQTVVVACLGYRSVARQVNIAAGETTQLDLALEQATLQGEEVVVTASRRAEKCTNAPATISLISAKMIAEHASFNVAELLARQRGVDYTRNGMVGIGVNARGFNSAVNPKFLQINDGRLSTLIASGLPFAALSTTIKEDIERSEVVLGPSSALYGPNAHNGLLNTITKDPRTYPGTTVALGAGNQALLSGRFRHASRVSDKFAFKISGEYTQGEDFAFTDTVYAVANGVELAKYPEYLLDRRFDHMAGEAQAYVSVSPKADLIAGYGASRSNNIGNSSAGRNQVRDWSLQWAQIRYVSPRLFLNLYHTWSNTDSTIGLNRRTLNYWSFKNARNADGTPRFDEATARSKSLSALWVANPALPAGGQELARGALFQDQSRRLNAELQYNNAAGKLFDYIVGLQYQQDLANSNRTYLLDQAGPIRIDQVGAYAQLERRMGDFRAVLAARADNHALYGFNFIPKAALVYLVGDNGAARLTYGQGIAAPTILNLSANIFGGLLLGNGEGFTVKEVDITTQQVVNSYTVPRLKVEKVQTLELGYKGMLGGKLFLDANAYFNRSQDFLSPAIDVAPNRDLFDHDNNPATPNIARIVGYGTLRGGQPLSEITTVVPITPSGETGANTVLSYLNFGRVNTYGFDAALHYALLPSLNATLNYAWFGYDLDRGDLANDGNKDGKVNENDLPINTPAHKAGLGLNYGQNRVFASIFGRWVQAYDFFSGINVAASTNSELLYGGSPVLEGRRVGSSFNYGPLGGFVNVDLGIGYKFGKHLSLSGQVTNLFDSAVREFVASPSIARLYALELKVDLWHAAQTKG
jgi:iron complex outermembrane receptor protein